MAENIFKQIDMRAGNQRKSYIWYKDQVRNLGSGVSGTQLLRNEKLSARIIPGEMYLFMYDPKHKKPFLTMILFHWSYLLKVYLMDS